MGPGRGRAWETSKRWDLTASCTWQPDHIRARARLNQLCSESDQQRFIKQGAGSETLAPAVSRAAGGERTGLRCQRSSESARRVAFGRSVKELGCKKAQKGAKIERRLPGIKHDQVFATTSVSRCRSTMIRNYGISIIKNEILYSMSRLRAIGVDYHGRTRRAETGPRNSKLYNDEATTSSGHPSARGESRVEWSGRGGFVGF